MPKYTSILARSLALALPIAFASTMAIAQSDTTEETPEEAPSTPNELSLGETAPEGPQVGETYIKEEFGDWDMRCIKTENGEDPCQMYQLLSNEEGTPISEFTLFKLPEGGQAQAGATVVVPLETSLAGQLTIKIDDKPAKRYPFAFCNRVGCYARIGLTDEDINSFKRGGEAVISIVPIVAQDQRVNVSLSLSGFTASYDVVSVIDQ
ncbi:invasion associated locus B family protein [uncultured Roseobacter sp.]|uniref:invasion associated locus B family protein n=1 Tax=uncultured Roseobacter sp. TaxID=114847 RepID=UPI002615E1C3|nr:invasion associated locus B family protein [uncultured Roseobacter sp.]